MGTFKDYLFEQELQEFNEHLKQLDESAIDQIKPIVTMLGMFSYPFLKDMYDVILDKLEITIDKKESFKEKLHELKIKIMSLFNKNKFYKDVYYRTFEPLVEKISKKIKSDEHILNAFKEYMSTKDAGIAQGHELLLRNFFESVLTEKERIALRTATTKLKPVIGSNVQDKRLYDILSRLK